MATYRFTLRTPEASVVFGARYVSNWKDIRQSLTQSDTYRFLFREFSSTIEFVGKIKRMLTETIDKHGYDCEVFLTIETGNNNKEPWSFKIMASRMRGDIKESEVTDLRFLMNFVDNSLAAAIQNKGDVDVNIANRRDVFDNHVSAFNSLRRVHLHDRRIIYESLLEMEDESGENAMTTMGGTDFLGIGISTTAKYSSGDNINNIFGIISDLDDPEQRPLHSFISSSEFAGMLTVDIKAKGYFDIIVDPASEGKIAYSIRLRVWGSETTSTRTILLYDNGVIDPNTPRVAYDINFKDSFQIYEGESVGLCISLSMAVPPSLPSQFESEWYVENNRIKTHFIGEFPATECNIVLAHDLFTRITRMITGQNNVFYSEIFGRKELGYNVDGELAYLGFANGKMIRDFPFFDDEVDDIPGSPIIASFEYLFNNLSKCFNLAAGIQVVNGVSKFRIDPIDNFRSQEVITTIEHYQDISRTIDYSKIFSSIRVGYREHEYEELNGLYAFHGETLFSAPFDGDAEEMDLVCEIRADDIGAELTRRKQFDRNPTTDYRTDGHLFMFVCTPKINGLHYLERFANVTGVYEPDRAYNIRITPKRNLIRWKAELGGSLFPKTDKSLIFQSGPKNINFESNIGDEMVVERDDILISSLGTFAEYPEIITIAEAELPFDDWQNLLNNKGGLIKITDNKVPIFCRAKLIDFDNNKNTANFELTRVNF